MYFRDLRKIGACCSTKSPEIVICRCTNKGRGFECDRGLSMYREGPLGLKIMKLSWVNAGSEYYEMCSMTTGCH